MLSTQTSAFTPVSCQCKIGQSVWHCQPFYASVHQQLHLAANLSAASPCQVKVGTLTSSRFQFYKTDSKRYLLFQMQPKYNMQKKDIHIKLTWILWSLDIIPGAAHALHALFDLSVQQDASALFGRNLSIARMKWDKLPQTQSAHCPCQTKGMQSEMCSKECIEESTI